MSDNFAIKWVLEVQNKIGPALKEAREQIEAVSKQLGTGGNAFNEGTAKLDKFIGGLGALGALGTAGIVGGLAGVGVAIGAVAVAAEKGAEHVRDLADAARGLENLSQKTGVATAHLQAMEHQLEVLGLPTEALGVSLKFLQKNIAKHNEALEHLGITSQDAYGAMLQLADLFERSADGPNKTRIALELLGRGGSNIIPFLNQGSAAMQEFEDHGRKIGTVFSEDTNKHLAEFAKASAETHEKWEGLKNSFSLEFLGVLERINGAMGTLADKIRGVSKASEAGSAPTTKWSVGITMLIGMMTGGANLSSTSGHGGGADWLYGPKWLGPVKPDKPQAPGLGGGDAGPWQDSIGNEQRLGVGSFDVNQGTRGNRDPKQALKDYAKSLQDMVVPMTQLTQYGKQYKTLLDDEHTSLAKLGEVAKGAFADGIRSATAAVVEGTATIGQAFSGLVRGVLQTIAEAAAQQGIGIGLEALGFAIMGPVGGFIGDVGAKLAGGHSARPVNVYVSAIDSQSALQSMISPSGSLRQANMRLVDSRRLP